MSDKVKWISPAEAALRLGVGTQTLRRWQVKGLITGIVLPTGRRRYRESDIDELISSGVREAE